MNEIYAPAAGSRSIGMQSGEWPIRGLQIARRLSGVLARSRVGNTAWIIAVLALGAVGCGVTSPPMPDDSVRPRVATLTATLSEVVRSGSVDTNLGVQASFYAGPGDTNLVAVERFEFSDREIFDRVGEPAAYDSIFRAPFGDLLLRERWTFAVWGANGVRSFRHTIEPPRTFAALMPENDTIMRSRDLVVRWRADTASTESVTVWVSFRRSGADAFWFAEITDDGVFVLPVDVLARADAGPLNVRMERTRVENADAVDGRRIVMQARAIVSIGFVLI